MTEGRLPPPGLWPSPGQASLRDRISAAAERGRLPQSMLLHGPQGTGKRSLALWTAALLQCSSDAARPCGACHDCRLAGRLEHPDIHLHFPMPRPKRASSRAKLREAIESLRSERLAQLREDPFSVLDEGEVTGIYLAAVENIRAQAARRPAMSGKAIFVVDDADRMVPQSSSPEAANAFLKLLEEPPEFAHILLTSSRPAALLPTIRSRTAPLRVAPIPEDEVTRHLVEVWGAEPAEARAAAGRAEGSIGRARALWKSGPEDAAGAGGRLLAAALEGSPRSRYRMAGEYSARGARSTLQPALEELRGHLRDVLCRAAGAETQILDPETLERLVDRRPAASGVLEAMRAVDEALEGATQNLNPQATVAVLLEEMDRAFAETS